MNKKAINEAINKLRNYDADSTKVLKDTIKEFSMFINWVMKEYFPCGVKFEMEQYEEEDLGGNDVTVKEYYLIDKNTDEIFELESEEEYKVFKSIFRGYR